MDNEGLAVARSAVCDVLRVLWNRQNRHTPWSELLSGQGCGFVVDLGIGGPAFHYENGNFCTVNSPLGREFLALTDGYYSDHQSLEDYTKETILLRRTEGRSVDESPFPLEIPCFSSEATWSSSSGSVVVRQVYFVIWNLRRNYFKPGAGNRGAERAARDEFLDLADLRVGLEMDRREGPVPESFRHWLLKELA